MGRSVHHLLSLPSTGALWRGDELGGADAPVRATGHAALDAQLPGGGWPVGAMTEVLQAAPGSHVWPLLLPALAQAVARHPDAQAPVVLIGAPHEPFGPALAAAGVPVEALLWVRAEAAAARLWACEQALRCADVAAVLAWLPQARVAELRRLQLAAARQEGLFFVLRPAAAAQGASPARLRLRVQTAEDTDAADRMEVHILKRRGPPLAEPVRLPARSGHLSALLDAARQRRRTRPRPQAAPPARADVTAVPLVRHQQEQTHALAGAALAG